MTFFKNRYYLDPEIYQREQAHLFNHKHLYLGQEALVPSVGDYHVLDDLDGALVLVRSKKGVHVLHNVCRHRQATLLAGRGNTKRLVCPLHGWSYRLDGSLFRCPGFDASQASGLQPVSDINIQQGFIFKNFQATRQELAQISTLAQLDFEQYQLIEENQMPYNFGWKEYMDVFLDINHVNFIHPGLKYFVDVNALTWDFGDTYSLQRVELHPRYQHTDDPKFKRYIQLYQQYFPERSFDFGAIWILLYPNITIDIFQDFFSIAVTVPKGIERCIVYERVYAHQSIAEKTDLVKAFSQAFAQIELEDAELMYKTHEGRCNLYRMNQEDAGPYQNPTELGMQYFHQYLMNKLDLNY